MFNKKKKSQKNIGGQDSILDVLSDEVVIMFGELRKKGKVNTAWKSRWCELSFLEEGLILSYYLSKLNKKLCGTIKTTDIYALKVINYDEKEFEDYNLPEGIDNNNTAEISDLKYSFALCTLSREFVLAAPNKTDFIGWIEIFNKYIYGHIIYEGFLLLKKEKTTNTWKQRYFVLNEYKQFKYYEDIDKKTFCGAISLSEVDEITNGKVYDDSHKFTFNLHSKKNKRKWVCCAKSMPERQKWQQKIKQIRSNEEIRIIGQNDILSDDDILSDRDIFSDVDIMSDNEENTDIKMSDCSDISTCKSLDRVSEALLFFSTIIDKSLTDENTMNLLLNYFENDGKSILNDYGHLLHLHLDNNKNKNINTTFKSIHSKINKLIDCTLNKCKCYNRNTRHRAKEKINDDSKISYYVDLMDTIHTYFIHIYDIGYKLKQSKDDNEEYTYDEYSEMIYNIRNKNKPKPTHRFTTYIPQNINKDNILSVGHRFNYWDDNDEYYVPPKFATFKKEIIGRISIGGYNLSIFKAENYLQSIWMRRIKITIEQMLALMIYIDYDKFADNMKKSFIRGYTINDNGIKLAESNKSLIKRNSKYAHLAKYLSEVIDGFGDNPMDKTGDTISFYTSPTIGGISNISTMDLSKLRLFGIHSTTSSIEVIISNNNGVIMELNNTINSSDDKENDSQWPSWQNTTYFKCNFFSSKGYENEIIFTNTYNPLSINSMKVIYDNNEWIGGKTYMNAMVILKKMVSGCGFKELNVYKKKHFEIILKMLKEQEDELPEFIFDVYERIKENVYEMIIDLNMFEGVGNKAQRKQIMEYFVDENIGNGMLKYKRLMKMFENVSSITVKNTNGKITVGEEFMEEIVDCLEEINNNMEDFGQIALMNVDLKCDLKDFKEKCMDKMWKIYYEKDVKLSIIRLWDDEEEEDEYQMDIQKDGSFYEDDDEQIVMNKDKSITNDSNSKEDNNNNNMDNDDDDDDIDDEEKERIEEEERKRKELEEQKRKKREERRKQRQAKRSKNNDDKKEQVEQLRDKVEQKLKKKENEALRKNKYNSSDSESESDEKPKGKKKYKPKGKPKKNKYYSSSDNESESEEKPKKKLKPKPKRKAKPKKKRYSNSDSGSDSEYEKPKKKVKRKPKRKAKPKKKRYSSSDSESESEEKPKKKVKSKKRYSSSDSDSYDKPKKKVKAKKKYIDNSDSDEKPKIKKKKSKGKGKIKPKKKSKKIMEEGNDGIDQKPNIKATAAKRNSQRKLKSVKSAEKLDKLSKKKSAENDDKNKKGKKKRKTKDKDKNKGNSKKLTKDKKENGKSKSKKKKPKRSKSKKKIKVEISDDDNDSDLSNSDGF